MYHFIESECLEYNIIWIPIIGSFLNLSTLCLFNGIERIKHSISGIIKETLEKEQAATNWVDQGDLNFSKVLV